MNNQANDLTNESTVDLSRRKFLVGSVASTVVMAFAASDVLALTGGAQSALADKIFSPTVWFEINTSGEVLININKAEMGQHIGTALARVIADELGADWHSVKIKHVDAEPKWGYMVTGGSWSVFQSFKPLSQAGAAGRVAMIEAGAKLLGKSASKCKTVNGHVVCGSQSVSFAEVVKRGDISRTFSAEEIAKMPVKSANQRSLTGKDVKALDIPAKTNGTAQYGIDVNLPGMIYARPVVAPTRYGSKVTKVDDSKARVVKGYLGYHILKDPSETVQGWVAVTAESYFAAIKAADVIKVSYDVGPTSKVSEQDIQTHGMKLLAQADKSVLFVNEGDIEASKNNARDKIEAVYRTATANHFQLEPLNAVVEEKNDLWHVHCGNQWQSLSIPTLAKAVGISEDKIKMHQYFLGGGFGRRLYGDWIVPAMLTAKAAKCPVKMIFTRPDDTQFDQFRSPSVQKFAAYFDRKGELDGIDHGLTSGWPTLSMAPGFMPPSVDKKGKFDPFSTSGADHWYDLAHHRVRAANNDLAQQTFLPGWLRSVGPGWIGWGVESFIDEIAYQQGEDPIDFRLKRLTGKGINAGKAPESVGGAIRLKATLERLKSKMPSKSSLAKDEGIGVALSFGQERSMPTWIACSAHIKVDRNTGAVKVKKITMICDAGTVVHPDGALAQIEGSIMWGVSLALHEYNEIVDGNVSKTNLHTYTPLRMADIPEVDIEFMPSDEMPTGLGEPGVIAVAPAIGNGIFNAVGARVRDLPITADAVKALI